MEMLEVDELSALCEGVTPAEIEDRRRRFTEFFDIQPDCPAEDLRRSARTSVALDRMIEAPGLARSLITTGVLATQRTKKPSAQ